MTKMVKTMLNGEHEIIVPEHRLAQYAGAGWERARMAKMREVIEQQVLQAVRPVVHYAGTEEGEMAALCQIWGADVVLFEPSFPMWPNIRAIWEANDLEPPIASIAGFASDHTDLVPPNRAQGTDYCDGWPAVSFGEVSVGNGFKELHDEHDAFVQVAIDDVATDYGPPTIISVDCEGSDWQVLKGAEQTLLEHHPTLFISIHPEFMFRMWDQYSRDFRNWIQDHGYVETILDYAHELHCLYVPA